MTVRSLSQARFPILASSQPSRERALPFLSDNLALQLPSSISTISSRYSYDNNYYGSFAYIYDYLTGILRKFVLYPIESNLIAYQLNLGFIPGRICSTDSDYYIDALGNSGLYQLNNLDSHTRSLLLELGYFTVQVGKDPNVTTANQAVHDLAMRIATGCLGELGSGYFSGSQRAVLSSYSLPSLLAGATASATFKKPLAISQA